MSALSTEYGAFLARKTAVVPPAGMRSVPPLPAVLKPFQRDIVTWALRQGRAAIFAGTGLGKTAMIRRCCQIWTNPGDIVLSPFAGIGSEGYVALEMDRRFVGIELKQSYYEQAVTNLRTAERSRLSGTLFDFAERRP